MRDISSIRRVLITTMLLNFLATSVKLAAGIVSGSLGVVADALDTLFDATSNIVGLLGLSLSAHPPDKQHPYGHRKFETMAALGIALLLFLTSWELLRNAAHRFSHPQLPDLNEWTFAAVIFGIVLQSATSFYELRQGRLLRSEILVADALHTRANVLISLSVLVGIVFVKLGYTVVDPLLGAGVALFIAKIGVDIVRENVPALVDQAIVDEEVISRVISEVPGVESFHRIRSRGAPGNVAVDLHLRVSPRRPVQEGEAIADEVRRRLLQLDGVSDVTIHVEAQKGPEPEAGEIFATVKQVADALNVRVHESSAHQIEDELTLEIHVGVPPHISLAEAHTLADRLEREAAARLPQVNHIQTHIEPANQDVLPGHAVSPELRQHIECQITRAVATMPELGEPHNIQARLCDGRLFLSFECRAAPALSVVEAHRLTSQLEAAIAASLPNVAEVLIHLEPTGEETG
ncbi:MAG: cation-efflux pump [Anaerolineae bacterium]|nr:cation-efflux pump [Anaerolineae bacterium]MDW8099303.1 cation-efflux pump [Anaerolineae bacterium]